MLDRGGKQALERKRLRMREHKKVTVIFIDIVDFSTICTEAESQRVLGFLEHYFELLDNVAEANGVTKIRTVGDGYLAVAGVMSEMGVEQDAHQHSLRTLCFGLGVLMEVHERGLKMPNGQPLRCRVGMAHGTVYSGVVGRTCMQYDIFGSVANLASRMEHGAPINAVQMPKTTFDEIVSTTSQEDMAGLFDGINYEVRKNVMIKNMAAVDTVCVPLQGNENRIKALLMGCLFDDKQRAVPAHIGVAVEKYRMMTWSTKTVKDELPDVDDEAVIYQDGGDNEANVHLVGGETETDTAVVIIEEKE